MTFINSTLKRFPDTENNIYLSVVLSIFPPRLLSFVPPLLFILLVVEDSNLFSYSFLFVLYVVLFYYQCTYIPVLLKKVFVFIYSSNLGSTYLSQSAFGQCTASYSMFHPHSLLYILYLYISVNIFLFTYF